MLRLLVKLRLPRGTSPDLWGGVCGSLREVLEKPCEAQPMVRMSVGDVDAPDPLPELLCPTRDLVRVLEGQQGVDEDALGRSGDQRTAGWRPGRDFALLQLIGRGVRSHRSDVNVN